MAATAAAAGAGGSAAVAGGLPEKRWRPRRSIAGPAGGDGSAVPVAAAASAAATASGALDAKPAPAAEPAPSNGSGPVAAARAAASASASSGAPQEAARTSAPIAVGQRVQYYSATLAGGRGGWVEAIVEAVRLDKTTGVAIAYDLSRKRNAPAKRVRAYRPRAAAPTAVLGPDGSGKEPGAAAAPPAPPGGPADAEAEGEEGSSEGFDIGDQVLYWSETRNRWVTATVETRRPLEGTTVYDLSCKRGVPAGRLRPLLAPGEQVEYFSDQTGRWMPARVLRILDHKGMVDLNIKHHARWEKVRRMPGGSRSLLKASSLQRDGTVGLSAGKGASAQEAIRQARAAALFELAGIEGEAAATAAASASNFGAASPGGLPGADGDEELNSPTSVIEDDDTGIAGWQGLAQRQLRQDKPAPAQANGANGTDVYFSVAADQGKRPEGVPSAKPKKRATPKEPKEGKAKKGRKDEGRREKKSKKRRREASPEVAPPAAAFSPPRSPCSAERGASPRPPLRRRY